MKISPVAQGTGVPAAPLNNSGAPVDRKEAAKAAFLGQATVTESDSYMDPQIAKARANIKRIKMQTNFSTNRMETPNPQIDNQNESTGLTDSTPETGIPHEGSDAEPVIEETKPLSPQFAALARQKRALQVKEREIADRERALASQAPKEGGDVLAKLKSNPLAVLQEAGVTYDELTQAILANPNQNNPDIQALREELKATKEEFGKTLTERDAQTERQALAEMRRTVDRLVAQGDDFEMVRETGSQAEVISLIKTVYKTEGVVLDETEAAILVEEELLKEAEKIARIKKLQNRLAPAQSAPAEQVVAQQQPRQMRTLTNRDGAAPAISRRERAIRAALGQLK